MAYVPLETSPSWTTGGNYNSRDVALGDFDYDGDLDLASFGQDNVILYRNNNGNLDFAAYWMSTDGTSGQSGHLAWADIDNDHYPELFTRIGMFKNTNGALAAKATLTNISLTVFALGDVNRDGYVDLVTGKTDLIEIYENTGGVIDETPDWNTTELNSPGALALGDADNDGYQELAVGNKYDPIRLYENVGGSLHNVSKWNSSLTDYVGCLAWGDVAQDHFPELYACTQPLVGGAANRLYANFGGTLEQYPSWNSTVTSAATEAIFVDINADSYLDLAVSNVPYMSIFGGYSLGQEMVYLNDNGVMNKTQGWNGPYQDVSYGLDVGLIDNDAYPDMVVASSEDLLQTYPGRVLVYKGLPPNRPPEITSVTATGERLRPGDESTISVEAEDPDGNSLQYDFSVEAGNGTILSEAGATAVWRAPSSPGLFIVNITVSDGKGGFDYENEVMVVWPNRAPQIDSVSANPERPKTGQVAAITVTASDIDGDALQYSFSVTPGNGSIESQTGAVASWRAPDAAGTYVVNITVSDGRGGFAYHDLSVAVESSPTDIPFFSISNVWFLLLLFLVSVVIAAVAVALAKRRKKPDSNEAPPPPAQEEAK